MVVCKFWLQGSCKFGDRCRFDHPSRGHPGNQTTNNRFAPLNYDSPGHGGRGATTPENARPNHGSGTHEFNLNTDEIRRDLTTETPIWFLSAYGPGRDAPTQLFGGYPREQSFEEVRLHYYELGMTGRINEANMYEDRLVQEARQQIDTALADLPGAIKYIIEGEKQHPNRHDVCRETILNPHFQKTFQKPYNPFAASNATGPHPMTSTTPEQRPVAQPLSNTGQSTDFQQSSRPVSLFGQPSNVFSARQPAAPGPSIPGFSNTGNQQHNPFAQNSAAKPPSLNPFAQTANAPSTNGAGSKPYNPFSPTKTNAEELAMEIVPDTPASAAGFNTSSGKSTTTSVGGQLQSFKGQPVIYENKEPHFRRPDGKLERIWFPNGQQFKKPEDLPLNMYDDELKEQYAWMMQHGTFKDAIMPELPPKREWTSWDF